MTTSSRACISAQLDHTVPEDVDPARWESDGLEVLALPQVKRPVGDARRPVPRVSATRQTTRRSSAS